MIIWTSAAGMLAALLLFVYAFYRQKNYMRLPPPLVAPNLLMFLALIVFLVFGAQLFASLTGLSWSPPHSRL